MKNEHREMPGRSAVDCLTRSVLGIKEKRLATSPSALLKRRIKRFEERGFRLRRRVIQRFPRDRLSVLTSCGLNPFAMPLPASTVRYLRQRGPTCSPGPASGHAPDSRDSTRHYRRRSACQPAIAARPATGCLGKALSRHLAGEDRSI